MKRINRGKIAEDAHEKLKRSFKDKIDLDLLLQKEKFIDPETHKIKFETDNLYLPRPFLKEEGNGNGSKELVFGDCADCDGTLNIPDNGGGLDNSAGAESSCEVNYVEFSLEEFIKMAQEFLIEDLKLPELNFVMTGGNVKEDREYDDFSRFGALDELDIDQTFEDSLVRHLSEKRTGACILDPKKDGWYWNEIEKKVSDVMVLEEYVMDISGSINPETSKLIRKTVFCLWYYLDKFYQKNERKYIFFNDNAKEVTLEEFLSVEPVGGTRLSEGIKLGYEISQEYRDYNKFFFFFSDLDNSTNDDEAAYEYIERVLEEFDYIYIARVNPNKKNLTGFYKYVEKLSRDNAKIYIFDLNESSIKEMLLYFLGQNGQKIKY
ncbi:DUF444 family protein [Candidatus Woesearchaeota archaeon]|nr:DUF444 family protein [Candidatus Woesearchaeota archaeon]